MKTQKIIGLLIGISTFGFISAIGINSVLGQSVNTQNLHPNKPVGFQQRSLQNQETKNDFQLTTEQTETTIEDRLQNKEHKSDPYAVVQCVKGFMYEGQQLIALRKCHPKSSQ